MKIEWKEEQCRTNSLQVATSQHFSCSFRIRSIYIHACSMLFIGEKRDVAFSESFWYLGGANVQCTQSKIKRHMYHYLNTYMLLKISTNSSKHLDFKGAIKDLFLWVSLSNKTYVFLLFRATDQGEQRIGMVSLASPGEKKENVATEQLVGFDGGMFCFFPHINRVCATIGFTVSWEARVFLNLRMTKNSEGISWIHPQRPNHCSNFDIVTIWVHHRQDYFVRGELGNRKSLGDLFSRWK